MIEPVEKTFRPASGRGVWRDFLLVLLGVLPCGAILALTCTVISSREAPHRMLQAMTANERLLRAVTDLSEQLQRERAMTALSAVGAPDLARLGGLDDQIRRTDRAMIVFQHALGAVALDRERVDAARAVMSALEEIRDKARRAGPDQWQGPHAAYGEAIDEILGAAQATTVTETDRGLGKAFVKLVLIQNAREAASRLQTFLAVHRAAGEPISSANIIDVARLWTIASEFLTPALSDVSLQSERLLRTIRQSTPWRNLRDLVDDVVARRSDPRARNADDFLVGEDTLAAGILAIERQEGDHLLQLMERYGRQDLAQQRRIRFWAVLAMVGQCVVVAMIAGGIAMRRRLARTYLLLSDREADLDTTLRSIGDAVIAADTEGRVTRMNTVAESLTGWALADAVGKPLGRIFHYLDAKTRAQIVPPILKVPADGEASTFTDDTVLIARDGTEHRITESVAPIVDAEGVVRGGVLVFRDTTAESQVREKLLESETLHREMMQNLPAGIVIIDPETRVIENVNPYAANLFGAPEEQIVGHQCHAFLCPAEENACPICDLDQTMDNSERVMLRANGTRVPILKSVKRIQTQRGEKLVECFVDISANKQTEEDLRRAKQALEQHVVALRFANQALEQSTRAVETGARAKGELLANMSDEILTTTTAILGFAERLLVEPGLDNAPPHRVEAFQTIERNGRHLMAIINNILDLSKLEAGKLEPEPDDCSPAALLEEVVSRTRPQADAKGLSLAVEYDGPLPETIRTDPARLRQILVHLLSNAVQFTDSGQVRIVASIQDAQSARPKLVCTIVDTGIGMSPGQIERLFEPFEHQNDSADPKYGCTGLGLAISKRLAELLEGGISVESVPGQGSSFTVSVATGPLDGVCMIDEPGEIVTRVAAREKPCSALPDRLDCRVLLAEDTPDIQRLISAHLQDLGAEVVVVDNGQLAVEQAWDAQRQDRPYDVILMDMQMPVMDGFEATHRLRLEGYAGPIIALVVRSMKGHRRECLKSGCNHFLTKPIDPRRLISLVAQSVAEGSLHAGAMPVSNDGP